MQYCKIQWIDEKGVPTPDDNPAVGVVWMDKRTYTRSDGTPVFFAASERFPICLEHLAQLKNPGMQAWHFEVFSSAIVDALEECQQELLRTHDGCFERMMRLFPRSSRTEDVERQWVLMKHTLSSITSAMIAMQRLRQELEEHGGFRPKEVDDTAVVVSREDEDDV